MSPFTLLEVSGAPALLAPAHATGARSAGAQEPECSIKRRYAIHGG